VAINVYLFAAFAEFERNLIEKHSAAGRAAAKARGRLGGRPEKYGSKDIEMMKALIESGTPIKDVAEKWGVSRTTIYRYLKNSKSESLMSMQNEQPPLTAYSEEQLQSAKYSLNRV